MDTQENFLAEINRFINLNAIPPSIFGIEAVGDPNFLYDLEKGRSPQLKTVERVRKFMNGYKVSKRGHND